jgi:hypothetical protein
MLDSPVLITHPSVLASQGKVKLMIQVEVELNISADEAYIKVERYLAQQIKPMPSMGQPILLINKQQFLWRVPILWQPEQPPLTFINVDPQSGELLVTSLQLETLKTRVTYLAAREKLPQISWQAGVERLRAQIQQHHLNTGELPLSEEAWLTRLRITRQEIWQRDYQSYYALNS